MGDDQACAILAVIGEGGGTVFDPFEATRGRVILKFWHHSIRFLCPEANNPYPFHIQVMLITAKNLRRSAGLRPPVFALSGAAHGHVAGR